MATGTVQIQILDGGGAAVVVPGATTQLIMGVCSAGTVNQIIATQNPNTLVTNLGYGPLVEAAALVCQSGGTVLAMRVPITTAGSFQSGGVQFTGTGSSVITTTGAPYDTYYIQFTVVTGGTIGSAGIQFTISLDAGRNTGATLALGTATTYSIPNTNVTLNFAAGTLVAADVAKVGTIEPKWQDSDVQAALQAFQASPYAIGGVGSMFLVGDCGSSDTTTIDGYMTSLATGYVFNRLIENARDAHAPVAYGGAGETEATWAASIALAFSAVSAERACVSGGHYNVPSVFKNPAGGTPSYRRPCSWALAAREVTIPPQRHAGRVKDGPFTQIVINPITDPTDGFVYYDGRLDGNSLDVARFNSLWTRIGLPGFFDVNPNLMSPLTSSFPILPLGNVMDIACDIVHQIGQVEIDSDVRTNPNGTIYENDARSIEAIFSAALQAQMLSNNMISGFTVTVDRTNNILLTSTVNVTVTITPRGYVEEVSATIGFLTSGQAQP